MHETQEVGIGKDAVQEILKERIPGARLIDHRRKQGDQIISGKIPQVGRSMVPFRTLNSQGSASSSMVLTGMPGSDPAREIVEVMRLSDSEAAAHLASTFRLPGKRHFPGLPTLTHHTQYVRRDVGLG